MSKVYIANQDNIVNPNLLNNPDFKINQLGLTEYDGSLPSGSWIFKSGTYPYCVDDWRVGQYMKINVYDDHIRLSRVKIDTVGYTGVSQRISINLADKLVTISVKAKGVGRLFTAQFNQDSTNKYYNLSDDYQIYTNTFTFKNYTNEQWGNTITVSLDTNNSTDYADIEWVKLELGDRATPFIPPNPALELLKCQRYLFISDFCYAKPSDLYIDNTRLNYEIQFPVTMKSRPTFICTSYKGTIGVLSNLIDGSDTSGTINVLNHNMNNSSGIHRFEVSIPDVTKSYTFKVYANAMK